MTRYSFTPTTLADFDNTHTHTRARARNQLNSVRERETERLGLVTDRKEDGGRNRRKNRQTCIYVQSGFFVIGLVAVVSAFVSMFLPEM